jgi:hypothetical protein
MGYQDRWINGKVRAEGQRECNSRYEVIKNVLEKYQRPITVLDIGASEGYFSFRIAEDFESTCVMIEDSTPLLSLCKKNGLDNVIYLKKRITVEELNNLANCEHFDIVLALNVLHHFGDWKGACDAVFKLGDNVIIETPGPDDVNACNQGAIPNIYNYLIVKQPSLLCETVSHTTKVMRPMWHFKTPKIRIMKSYMGSPASSPLGDVRINSTIEEKTIDNRRKNEKREWIQGINLRTYQKLNGVFPTRDDMAYYLEYFVLPEEKHGDIFPWNFILTGKDLVLIDGGDDRAMYGDKNALAKVIRDIRGKRAFLVIGAESTGTRLATKILMENGCVGDNTHHQPFDKKPGEIQKHHLVVWRRSFPHNEVFPNIKGLVNLLKGFRVTVVVTIRDWYTTSKSNVRVSRAHNLDDAYARVGDAYLRIFQQIIDNNLHYVMLNYDSLVLEPENTQKTFLANLRLPFKTLVEITNENRKHYDS